MPILQETIPSAISATEAAIKLSLDYPGKEWQGRFCEIDDLDGSFRDR